jgi:hypothetical protein
MPKVKLDGRFISIMNMTLKKANWFHAQVAHSAMRNETLEHFYFFLARLTRAGCAADAAGQVQS